MSENYLEFFGLSENPFKLTPDVKFYYFSKYHELAIEHLRYFYNSKDAFAVIIGEPGVGKTITIRKFIDEIKDKVEIAYILFPNLSPEELFLAILEDLKIEIPRDVTKNKLFSILRDFLIEKRKEGKEVIIIIDEAQNLPNITLEELRIISNLETEEEKLVKILLVGQKELLDKINSPDLKQLRQRITIIEQIPPLDFEETKKYVLFKIHKANGNIDITEKAFKELHKFSHGYPRLINQIMERALMSAFVNNEKQISKNHIVHAAKSLNLESKNKKSYKFITILSVFTIFVILGLLLSFIWLQSKKENNKNIELKTNKENLNNKNNSLPKLNNSPANAGFYVVYFAADNNLDNILKLKKEIESKINKEIYITKLKNGLYALFTYYNDKAKAVQDLKSFKEKTGMEDIFLVRKSKVPEIVSY